MSDLQRPSYFNADPSLDQRIDKQTGKYFKGMKKLNNMISNAGSVEDAFRKIANKRASVKKQIAAAGNAFSDVEDPLVRRQLIRDSIQNIRSNRSQALDRAQSDYANRVNAKANLLSMRANGINMLLGRQNAQRGYQAQEYLDQASRMNAIKAMQAQKDAGLEFFGDAPGQYFLKTGTTSPSDSGSPWSVVAGQNNQNYLLNQKTGTLTTAIDPTTGEPIQEESFVDKLKKAQQQSQ